MGSTRQDQRLQTLVLLRKVRDRIDREYDRPLDVDQLARGVHLSAGYLSRQFKLSFGESPYSYLMTRRIERAMTLLRRADMTVTDVCFAVGFSSLGTFSTRFAELVGVPPRIYRESAAGALEGSRPAWPNRSADRSGPARRHHPSRRTGNWSGIEKRGMPRLPRLVAMNNITIHYTFLPHTDPEASLRFYRDLLGFEVRQDVGYEDMRWITVGPVEQPQTSIVLQPPAVDPGITDQEREVILSLIAKGSFAGMTLAVDDLDAFYQQLESAGADVVQEPIDQDYGVRDCAFRDPAGNLLRISQR